MPRKTRKARQAPVPKVETAAVPEPSYGGMPWSTKERLVVRCPCCGRTGEPSYTSKVGVTVGISEGPYELEVQLQRFGGSFPSPTHRMAGRRGFIEYEPQPQLLEEWRVTVREKLQAALDLLGG